MWITGKIGKKNILKEYMQCSFSFEKWSKAKRLIFSHIIMKFKALYSNAGCNVRYRSDQIKYSPVTDGVSGSSSSEDERERSESPPCPKNTKKVNRLFVWLSKLLKATPRGSSWDKSNWDTSVKDIEVDASHSERRLRERIIENFPALAAADLSR